MSRIAQSGSFGFCRELVLSWASRNVRPELRTRLLRGAADSDSTSTGTCEVCRQRNGGPELELRSRAVQVIMEFSAEPAASILGDQRCVGFGIAPQDRACSHSIMAASDFRGLLDAQVSAHEAAPALHKMRGFGFHPLVHSGRCAVALGQHHDEAALEGVIDGALEARRLWSEIRDLRGADAVAPDAVGLRP